MDRIDGFRISGHDVNLFYPPQVALKKEIEFNEDGRNLEGISLSSTKQRTEPCGRYRVSKNIDANIEVTAYATFRFNTGVNSVDSNSCMIITFSVPIGKKILIDTYYHIHHFFEYIAYRKNVDIGEVELFFNDENGLRDYSGILVFPKEHEKETHKKVRERIIKYHLMKKHTSKLLTAIKNNMLSYQHLCCSIDDMQHYTASRIIMILAEFEREYRNIYGQDSGRSKEYLEVKNEIVSLIESYRQSKQSKKRQYAKQFKKYIDNRDSSFEANVKNVLKECEPVMSSFVRKRYNGAYWDVIEGISSRMGEVRNGIAHSRLDLRIDAIHLSDIKIIEELIYVIRLKKYLSDADCRNAINDLFGERFAL